MNSGNAVAPQLPPKGEIRSLAGIRRYLAPYRWQAAGALLALLFTSSAVLGLGYAFRHLIDEGIAKGDQRLLDQSFILFLSLTLLLASATYARYYLVSWVGEKVIADMRRDVFAHLVRLHMGFFETARTGELLSRITTDTTLLQSVVGSSVSVALRNLLLFTGGSLMLCLTSVKLSGYVAVILPLVVLPIIIIGRQVRSLSRATQSRVADVSACAEEALSGMRTVKAYGLEAYETDRFNAQVQLSLRAALSRIRVRAALTALVIAFVFGAILTVLWIGGRDVMQGALSPGALSAFIFYSVIVASSVGALSEVTGELQRGAGAAERLLELLAEKPAIASPVHPVHLPEPFTGSIRFENVVFHYPTRPDKPALHNVQLRIEPGETVAIVGPSGAGKTTFFQLLLRFYDPQSGQILLDGVDIRGADLAALRAHIGIVPQDPVIFSGNAWDNIRIGRPSASAKEIITAASQANATEFLETLPDGMDTHLGEKGVRLSGGQKQRIAIARAMLRNPPILLLDEATSALDSENERKVQDALAQLMRGRTTLVIAHRLATVLNAHRIVVMNEGRVEAVGKHEVLLSVSPLYARLANLQFKAAA